MTGGFKRIHGACADALKISRQGLETTQEQNTVQVVRNPCWKITQFVGFHRWQKAVAKWWWQRWVCILSGARRWPWLLGSLMTRLCRKLWVHWQLLLAKSVCLSVCYVLLSWWSGLSLTLPPYLEGLFLTRLCVAGSCLAKTLLIAVCKTLGSGRP